jgi:hypothetical protein
VPGLTFMMLAVSSTLRSYWIRSTTASRSRGANAANAAANNPGSGSNRLCRQASNRDFTDDERAILPPGFQPARPCG